MAPIKFKVAAKTDVGVVRTNNEDNFQVSWDLSTLPMRWVNNEVHQLEDKGCLLVVADGMGGANAGEVASQIAIDTIKSKFVPEDITDKVMSSTESINGFIKDSIISADINIKTYAKEHPETKGMGTTIVIAWIIQDKLYIGWCGDSRAYIYNPAYGLIRITKDHSYVQQLVDSGKLTEEEAFDFPDSNIITQCLSASPQKCHPDTLTNPIVLSTDDIVLLCTDGLCGMIRDTEIQSILKSFDGNVSLLSENLVSGAIQASGADNVTLCLFYAISGLKKASPIKIEHQKSNRKLQYFLFGGIVIIAILWALWLFLQPTMSSLPIDSDDIITDSISEVLKEPIVEDSLPQSHISEPEIKETTTTSEKEENLSGNGSNLLKGLNGVQIPKTEDKSTSNLEDEQEMEIASPPEVIIVSVPDTNYKSLYLFLREHDMNQSDFKKLNPGIDPTKVNTGDKIKVYKRK